MLRIEKLTKMLGKQVYTSEGDYFGQVEEVNLIDNKIDGWRIRVGSGFMGSLGGARGVIIPHQFVKAIGDVFVITRGSLPKRDEAVMDMASGDEVKL
ncbi:MAG: PRC-barrel domain-containing protein [Nanoarchaeota archaeon]